MDCIGEMEGALNACPLGSDSCISVYNDDSQHFVPPWTYDSTREVAVQQLIQVKPAVQALFEPSYLHKSAQIA